MSHITAFTALQAVSTGVFAREIRYGQYTVSSHWFIKLA